MEDDKKPIIIESTPAGVEKSGAVFSQSESVIDEVENIESSNSEKSETSQSEESLNRSLGLEAVKMTVVGSEVISEKEKAERFKQLRHKLGIVSWKKSSTIPINNSEVEHADNLPTFLGCINGYFVASDFLKFISENAEYIKADELSFIESIHDNRKRLSQENQNFYLMQLYDRALGRLRSGQIAENFKDIDFSSTKNVKHILKSDYIITMNKVLADNIEGLSKRSNQSMVGFMNRIVHYYLQLDKENIEENISKINYIDTDFMSSDYDTFIKKISEIIPSMEGMKHEVGFRALIQELNRFHENDVIEVQKVTSAQDSHGIDMILKVRVSKNSNRSGNLKLATYHDVREKNYTVFELPVDVKSTPDRADEALAKDKNYAEKNNTTIDRWVMWSHLTSGDFSSSMPATFDEYNVSEFINPYELVYINKEQMTKIRKRADGNYLLFKLKALIDDIIRGVNTVKNQKRNSNIA